MDDPLFALTRLGVEASFAWGDGCVRALRQRYANITPRELQQRVLEQFLYADLAVCAASASLPSGVASLHNVTLRGRMLLQVRAPRPRHVCDPPVHSPHADA